MRNELKVFIVVALGWSGVGCGGDVGGGNSLGSSPSNIYVPTESSQPSNGSANGAALPSGSGGSFGGPGLPAGGGGAAGAAASNAGDQFIDVGTSPFVYTAHDPFSTFAVDVDTASYDIFRRDVERGLKPVPASVRVEEYVNYFSYDYPAPDAGSPHPFAITLAAAPHVFDRETILLRVGIQGIKPPPASKKPTNLVFLVDVSGSMQSNDKLPLVKQVLSQSLDVLSPEDTVSMVTYAGSTGVRLPPTPAANRSKIQAVIDGLFAAGSTNGAGGIQLAYEQAQIGFIPGGINHVVLMTDGDFNVGVSDTTALVKLIEEKRKTGVTLTALGFGIGNLNDAMMEKVSDAGNGIYAHISSATYATTYVHERLLSTLMHIAQDVKIQVEFNPGTVAAYRLIGYENRAIADQDFRVDTVDAGEIGAGHRVTAVYELALYGGAVPNPAGAPALDGPPSDLVPEVGPTDLVLVKVRYKQPGATETDPATEIEQHLAVDVVAESLAVADPDLGWAAAVAAFAEIIKGSPFASPAALDQIAEIVAGQKDRDADRTEFAVLFAKARPMYQAMAH